MFKKLMNKRVLKNEKGLTLIELLAVIVILAIVAAIAIPAIGNIIDNSRYKAVKSDALNAMNAAQIYFTDNPEGVTSGVTSPNAATGTTVTTGALKELGYLENEGTLEGRGATITKTNGALSIKSQPITYASGNTIEFDGATIDSIAKDKTKAKDATGKKLGASGVPK